MSRDVPASDLPAYGPMSALRLGFVYALIACVIGPSLYCIVADEEHWPFSQYPMFSFLRGPTVVRLRLLGVVDAQESAEVSLMRYAYLYPLDRSRLPRACRRLSERPDAQWAFEEALMDCLHRYESRRKDDCHHGPALRGARLYRMTWVRFDPRRPDLEPDRKELLAEVFLPPEHGG